MGKIEEDDYESFLSDDCLSDFLRIIKKTPPATKEENREMLTEYFNGNLAIKDKIVEKNMLLVVSIASKIKKNMTSDLKLEYIQSGAIGLIEAIDTFDLSRGTAFSTHAEYQIQMRINKYRYNNERLVRRPQNIEISLGQYRRLLRDYEKENKTLPSRKKICSILNISEYTLKRLEEDYMLDAASIDAPVKTGDDDEANLKEIIGSSDDNFSNVLDKVVINELLKTLKMSLSEYEYYILYYRAINSKQKTLEEISEQYAITRERIRQVESKIIEKVRKMFDENHILKRKYIDDIKKKYPFESINIEPCPSENYTMFFFLRDKFKEKDQIILREKLVGKLFFDSERIATEIMESKSYVEAKSAEIDGLIKKASNDINYHLFHNYLLKLYRGEIYQLDLNSDLSDYLDKKNILYAYWHDISLEDILEQASLNNITIREELYDSINRFLGRVPEKEVFFNEYCINRDVNYSLFGFANHEISYSKLYQAFLENLDKLTPKQVDYLKTYVFNKGKKEIYYKGFSKYYGDSIINNLLLIYFNIEDYRKDNFSRDKYLSIREKCIKTMEPRAIELLDLYYGISKKEMNIREMAEYLKEDETQVETDFRRAKNNAIALYLGTNQYSYEDDREIYSSVLNDEDFTLGSPHLEVAKMFFLEEKSYEEIADEYASSPKITPRKAAELVKYACSAMDYYRFGITSTKKNYSQEFLLSVIEPSKYDEETKEIMRTYVNTKSASVTAEIHHKDLNEIHNIARKLNILSNKAAIEQVDITESDVSSSVMEHDSTNVLNERERMILSFVYGLKNKYNPSGEKKNSLEIAEYFGIKSNIGTLIRKAKEHVAAHKIGLLKTAKDFISRQELETTLRNPRLPLNEEDRNIIINAYGLYDTEYLTTQEISKRTGIREPIVRKRLYNGIVTIKKFLNKEIDGETIYEIDVEPYLKYFTLEDREILISLYRDKMSYADVENKYDLTHHQLALLHQKMRMHLSDLRSGTSNGIDFDYFWSNALESDVPYYGNQQLAAELCFLYYEKRLSKSEIVKYHHPELGDTTISELIKAYTIAMIKHQNGIRKINDFSYEEIADYYNAHKDEMGVVSTKIYRNYFAKVKRNGPVAKIRPNKDITYDLIREKYPDYFLLNKATSEEIRDILKNYGDTLPKNIIEILESVFGVTHANLLSDEVCEEIINILGPLQLIVGKNKDKKKAMSSKENNRSLVFKNPSV